MDIISEEVGKNIVERISEKWDSNGVAYILAVISTIFFSWASMQSDDTLAQTYQIFGIAVLVFLFIKLPIYYYANNNHFSDKSSASLGLSLCFIILSLLILFEESDREELYYTAQGITFIFAIIMIIRMNLKDSRLNVRKTFVFATALLLIQCIILLILLKEPDDALKAGEDRLWLQVVPTTALLIWCMLRLVIFLIRRGNIEAALIAEAQSEESDNAIG